MGYRIARIHNLDEKSTSLSIDFGVSESRGGDDANYYTLLVGNNGSGKTRVLKRIAQYFQVDKSPKLLIEVEPSSATLMPRRTIVITNTIGESYPSDKNREKSYNDLDYVLIGTRFIGHGLGKRFFMERAIRVLLESDQSAQRIKLCRDMFNTLGYHPVLSIEYRTAPKISRETSVFNSKIESYSHDFKIPELYQALVSHPDILLKGEHTLFFALNDSQISLDYSGALRNYMSSPMCDFIHDFMLLRRLGVFSVYSASIETATQGHIDMDELSTGESNWLCNMLALIALINDDSLVLIDEPEISLHPAWQMLYMSKLHEIINLKSGCHVIIASHSHFLATDLEPDTSSIIEMKRNQDGKSVATILPFAPYAWSAENILTEVFQVPSSRNIYFAQLVQEVLDMLQDVNRNEEKLNSTLEQVSEMATYLSENDPLKEVINEIITARAYDI